MSERRRILYGRRQGRRLRPGQRDLVENHLPQIEIDLAGDPAGIPTDGEIWLEIGFGGGEHLSWQARANPDVTIIGCEPFINGVVKLLGDLKRHRTGNVRLFRDDARLLLARLQPGSLDRAFILFPDPWPKTRHHKRRMVSDEVIGRLATLMRAGGELRIATDDPGYLEWILWHMRRHPEFAWLARGPEDWRRRPDDWPPTRYEEKAIAAGRACAFLRYRRRPHD
tara:strand:+ start:92 stop:766 length:675 start_codon:yes stop_codon:yes gene_type:complete